MNWVKRIEELFLIGVPLILKFIRRQVFVIYDHNNFNKENGLAQKGWLKFF